MINHHKRMFNSRKKQNKVHALYLFGNGISDTEVVLLTVISTLLFPTSAFSIAVFSPLSRPNEPSVPCKVSEIF